MTDKITEKSSVYNDLEQMNTHELLENINREDKSVADAVEKVIPNIEKLVEAVYGKMKTGGRLFYLGSGTSGRLGIVDASELPPTYGVEHGLVVGIIAGGDAAIRRAREFAEDDFHQGWKDLQQHQVSKNDFVIGISASGTTPYVAGALKYCRDNGISTGCICCNSASPVAAFADFLVEVITGPEFVTGSTRMKAGTAQKLILNMISTSLMIKMGRVQGNKMIDMQLSNNKLIDRGCRMIVELYGIHYEEAKNLLLKHGNVRKVIIVLNALK